MLMVSKARREIQVAGVRATAQAAIGGDKAVEAFAEFRDLINRVEIEDRSNKMREQLEQLKQIKEIRFRPLRATEKSIKLPEIDRSAVTKTAQRTLRPVDAIPRRAGPPKTRR